MRGAAAGSAEATAGREGRARRRVAPGLRRRAIASLLAALGGLAVGGPAPAQSGAWEVDPGDRAERVVLRYAERFPGLRGVDDPGPELVVRADGVATWHVPAYMRGAGDYTRSLSRPELRELLRSAARRGVADFDAGAVRAARAAVRGERRAAGRLAERSEATVTRVELSVARLRPPQGTERRDVEVRAEWAGLRGDARRYPGLRALVGLDAFAAELRALAADGGWRRVPGP